MDVNISQVGQNIAEIASRQSATQRSVSLEEANNTNSQQQLEQSNKVVETSADNSSNANSSATSIESAVTEISEFVQSQNRSLDFSVDENSQRSVVKVTDIDSGEVIRQIPSEEVLQLSERIKELQTDVGDAVGVLFNKQV